MDVTPAQLLDRGKERFALNDYFGAIHLLEELVERGRAYADAQHLLGLCYHLAGQPEKALGRLDEAIPINPRYIEALVHRGVVLGELGRTAEAQQAFHDARRVAIRGTDGIAAHHAGKLANHHAALGEAYAEAGGLDRAILQYRTALDLGPAFQDLRLRLGRLLMEAGRTLEARETLAEVVRNEETYHLVKETPKVTGFVGDRSNPAPIPYSEVEEIKSQMSEGLLRPKHRMTFEKGDQVQVVDGPFSNFNGLVEAVNPDKVKVRVLVSIFGRSTPVELDFAQVKKG